MALWLRVSTTRTRQFPRRTAGGSQYFPLPRIDFILVNVAYFTNDRIKLSRLVAAPRQVDQFPDFELGRSRCLQAPLRSSRRDPVLWYKSGAINVARWRLETHEWHV